MNWKEHFATEAHIASPAVSVRSKGHARFVGSAVYLAPGLFITAKHVAEEALIPGQIKEVEDNRRMGQLSTSLRISDGIEMVHMLSGKRGQSWPIERMTFWHELDFAILTTSKTRGPIPAAEIVGLPQPQVELHPLAPGQQVVSYGYFGDLDKVNKRTSATETSHSIGFTGRPGTVIALHVERASAAGSPVLEVNNTIEHMMSGGPTIDSEGLIVGINSSSLPTGDESSSTIVTMFMRALCKPFAFFEGGVWRETTLLELGKQNKIGLQGIEHIECSDEAIGWHGDRPCAACRLHKGANLAS